MPDMRGRESMDHRVPRFDSLRARLVLAATLLLVASDAGAQEKRDDFYWLGELNKAAAVMVVEQAIVPKPLGKAIAEAVAQVIADAASPGARRSGDYLQVEQLIIAI